VNGSLFLKFINTSSSHLLASCLHSQSCLQDIGDGSLGNRKEGAMQLGTKVRRGHWNSSIILRTLSWFLLENRLFGFPVATVGGTYVG
jgi:hypothetical protein